MRTFILATFILVLAACSSATAPQPQHIVTVKQSAASARQSNVPNIVLDQLGNWCSLPDAQFATIQVGQVVPEGSCTWRATLAR